VLFVPLCGMKLVSRGMHSACLNSGM
jgi:hypothetical protein